MSISINSGSCVGCGSCVEVCPGNLIKLRTRNPSAVPVSGNVSAEPGTGTAAVRRIAEIRHPRDCWGCTSCVKACPVQAIRFFLGADIGGTGATLTVTTRNDISTWRVTRPDGTVHEIQIDRKESNKY